MRYLQHLTLAFAALFPFFEPFFNPVARDFAIPVVLNYYLGAVISYFTIGPESDEKNETPLEFLASALANLSNGTDNVPAVVPRSDLDHPLVEALGNLIPHWPAAGEDSGFLSLHIAPYHVVLLVLAICIALYIVVQWPSDASTLPAWLGQAGDLDWDSELAPLAGLSSMANNTAAKSTSRDLAPRSFSLSSIGTHLVGLFKRSSVTTLAASSSHDPQLSPMMFSDPISFSSDDPDAVRSLFTSKPCDSPDDLKYPATPPPSCDSLVPLASVSSQRPQLVEEPLEEPHTDVTESASLLSPALSNGTDARNDDIYEDVPVMPDNYVAEDRLDGTTESVEISGYDYADATPIPLDAADAMQDISEAPLVRVVFEEPLVDEDETASVAEETLEVAKTEDAEESPVNIYPQALEEYGQDFDNLAQASQGSATSVSDVIGEMVSVKDWLSIKLCHGMMDDEMNVSGQNQMTFVRDHRMPIYFADPSLAVSLGSSPSIPSAEPSSPSASAEESDTEAPRRRTRTEPPIGASLNTVSLDAKFAAAWSLEYIRRELREAKQNSVVISALKTRYPQIWKQWRTVSPHLDLIVHDPLYVRWIPKAEERLALAEEARALKLAMEVLEQRGSFLVPVSLTRRSVRKTNQVLETWTRLVSTEKDDGALPLVECNDDAPSEQPRIPRSRTSTQADVWSTSTPPRLDGDNRMPRWIAAPDSRPRQRSRTRTTTFQSNAAVWEPDNLSPSHKRAISEGTLLQESGVRSKKAKMSSLKEMSRHLFLIGPPLRLPTTPTKTGGTASPATTPKTPEPSPIVVAPRPVARRRSSRPPQLSLMGTPKLATIIGSPTASPPATTHVHANDVPPMSLDELAVAVFDGQDKA